MYYSDNIQGKRKTRLWRDQWHIGTSPIKLVRFLYKILNFNERLHPLFRISMYFLFSFHCLLFSRRVKNNRIVRLSSNRNMSLFVFSFSGIVHLVQRIEMFPIANNRHHCTGLWPTYLNVTVLWLKNWRLFKIQVHPVTHKINITVQASTYSVLVICLCISSLTTWMTPKSPKTNHYLYYIIYLKYNLWYRRKKKLQKKIK